MQEDLTGLLGEYNFAQGGAESECIIVDPGTKYFLGEYSFTKYNNLKTFEEPYFGKYENLKVVGTPSTGTNHLDLDYLTTRGIKVFCLLDDAQMHKCPFLTINFHGLSPQFLYKFRLPLPIYRQPHSLEFRRSRTTPFYYIGRSYIDYAPNGINVNSRVFL